MTKNQPNVVFYFDKKSGLKITHDEHQWIANIIPQKGIRKSRFIGYYGSLPHMLERLFTLEMMNISFDDLNTLLNGIQEAKDYVSKIAKDIKINVGLHRKV
jgi:hypothetical protein